MNENDLNEVAITEVPVISNDLVAPPIVKITDAPCATDTEEGVPTVGSTNDAPDMTGFGTLGSRLFVQCTALAELLDDIIVVENTTFTTKKAISLAYNPVRETFGKISKKLYALRQLCLSEKAVVLATVAGNAEIKQLNSIKAQIAELEKKHAALSAGESLTLVA